VHLGERKELPSVLTPMLSSQTHRWCRRLGRRLVSLIDSGMNVTSLTYFHHVQLLPPLLVGCVSHAPSVLCFNSFSCRRLDNQYMFPKYVYVALCFWGLDRFVRCCMLAYYNLPPFRKTSTPSVEPGASAAEG
jgi:hypothetical protein